MPRASPRDAPRTTVLAAVRRWLAPLAATTLLLAALLVDWPTTAGLAWLGNYGEARWIRLEEPFQLAARPPGDQVIDFRTTVDLEATPPTPRVTVRAFRLAAVYLDGDLVATTGTDIEASRRSWREPQIVDLASGLTPGSHEILVRVFNRNGPAALQIASTIPALATDSTWYARRESGSWTPAIDVSQVAATELSRGFASPGAALARQGWLLAALVGLFGVLAWASHRPRVQRWLVPIGRSGAWRWGLVLAWSALAVNNVAKLPLHLGMDAAGHLDYVLAIAHQGRLPLANEGWQMFQSPLYYLVSAAALKLLSAFLSVESSLRGLRLIPLACGAAQVILCYRATRLVFPRRPDVQAVGTLVGGLLPMSLYMCQFVGNEPLAGLFSSVVILMTLQVLQEPERTADRRFQVGLGLTLGLALLTKVSAVLLLPVVTSVWALQHVRLSHSPRALAAAAARVGSATILVAGWYYLRNVWRLGRFFVGGWDPSRGIEWWQDPGFRTSSHLLSFGAALSRPLFAGIYGFWDGLYSTLWLDGFLSSAVEPAAAPPWNYDFLVASAWVSLLPTLVLAVGALSFRDSRIRGPILVCLGLFATFLAAMLWLYLTVPIYSSAKASYLLGLAPCFALLAAAGYQRLSHLRWSRSVLFAALCGWAICAYVGYWVV